MGALTILRINDDGRVAASSGQGGALAGASVGRLCHRVVAARDVAGAPICREGCVRELLDDSLDGTSERNGQVAGRDSRLECRRVGDQVVVVIEARQAPVCAPAQRLTPRERQSLALVARGLTRNEIAVQLGVQPCTVRTHLEHARERLGARTSAEAVAKWLESGQ